MIQAAAAFARRVMIPVAAGFSRPVVIASGRLQPAGEI
jgi:hypothetical protein